MCIVLDVNTFASIFDSNNTKHQDYKPVLDWVVYGKGKFIYGGKKYKDEMRKASRYIKFFSHLERAGKLICLCDNSVDQWQARLIDIEPNKDFDDPHLIAIILESKCKLICTNDKRAIPYLKDNRFYVDAKDKPKIYSSKKNASLLTDKYIADICKPCNKLSKQQIEKIVIF